MKDGIIKATGNSRLLKSPETIPATYAEFRTALLTGTLPVDLLYNAAGWDVEGTALNKANLLTDAVAEALGLTSDDPTVNEALNALLAVATSVRNGLMSATDKAKLDGVANNANNYVHPSTAGNKHIPAGGAAYQFLKYSAAGTAVWAGLTADITSLSTTVQGYFGGLANVEAVLKNFVKKDTVVVISSSGSWTPPRANMLIDVWMIGGGGGGSRGSIAGGGGGGGYAKFISNYKISSISPISVVIGAAGAGASSSGAGGDGGNTSFGNISTAGGKGGKSGSLGAGGDGGAGGGGAGYNYGGNGQSGYGGDGNGGANASGSSSNNGGLGRLYEVGLGGYCPINNTLYGGAGGGGSSNDPNATVGGGGGAGGGGRGGDSTHGTSYLHATNYGSGGGGSYKSNQAGNGYQGVIIIGYNS